MGTEKLAVIVNTFGSSLVSVSKEMGLEVKLLKSEVSQGVNVTGTCVAALVGVVGGGVQGTVVIMLDREGFDATVSAMSGQMIVPAEDSVSMSVIGELANMVSGRALVQVDLQGTQVTPPQLITGAGIRTIPIQSAGIRSFTLPFRVASGGTLFLVLSFHS
ncbi:chemotaxis protein CheX [Aminivibrio sp.]